MARPFTAPPKPPPPCLVEVCAEWARRMASQPQRRPILPPALAALIPPMPSSPPPRLEDRTRPPPRVEERPRTVRVKAFPRVKPMTTIPEVLCVVNWEPWVPALLPMAVRRRPMAAAMPRPPPPAPPPPSPLADADEAIGEPQGLPDAAPGWIDELRPWSRLKFVYHGRSHRTRVDDLPLPRNASGVVRRVQRYSDNTLAVEMIDDEDGCHTGYHVSKMTNVQIDNSRSHPNEDTPWTQFRQDMFDPGPLRYGQRHLMPGPLAPA